MRWHHKIKE